MICTMLHNIIIYTLTASHGTAHGHIIFDSEEGVHDCYAGYTVVLKLPNQRN